MKRIAILTLALFAAACGDGKKSDEPAKAPATENSRDPAAVVLSASAVQHGGVRWAAAELRAVAVTTEMPGQLVPNEDRTSRLGAPAEGRVTAVHVQPGDFVKQRAPLVTLQSAEASRARADYDKAIADLNARRAGAIYALSARARAERLLAAKAIAQQDLERARAEEELAKSELTRAEAEVARTRAALEQLGVDVRSGAMVLRAPISGVVLSREAVPGAVVGAGTPLVSVSDPSTLWLDIAATDRAAAGLQAGARVRFVVPAFPADSFEARVFSVGGAFDPQTRALPVRALVPNARGRLRAQMFATVWLEGETGAGQHVTVPESAIMLLDQRPVVFIARPGADATQPVRFERRAVQVGSTRSGLVPILSGIDAGDLVVTEGAFAVKAQFARAKSPAGE